MNNITAGLFFFFQKNKTKEKWRLALADTRRLQHRIVFPKKKFYLLLLFRELHFTIVYFILTFLKN